MIHLAEFQGLDASVDDEKRISFLSVIVTQWKVYSDLPFVTEDRAFELESLNPSPLSSWLFDVLGDSIVLQYPGDRAWRYPRFDYCNLKGAQPARRHDHNCLSRT
ncbi:hypothetical protein MYX75_02695 [Acidobacteria bacterium AH-259-A15]|nr:hypothetical protein [Acidobacteria bacterium AH-259-A15]